MQGAYQHPAKTPLAKPLDRDVFQCNHVYHNRLPLVLDNVTRSPNFISTSKAVELELIRWIHRFFILDERFR